MNNNIVCPSCGTPAEPGNRFCMACGRPYDLNNAGQNQVNRQPVGYGGNSGSGFEQNDYNDENNQMQQFGDPYANNNSYYNDPYNNYDNNDDDDDDDEPESKNTALYIILAVVAVIAVACIVFFAFKIFGNSGSSSGNDGDETSSYSESEDETDADRTKKTKKSSKDETTESEKSTTETTTSTTTATTTTTTAAEDDGKLYKVNSNKQGLNMRSSPNTEANNKITLIPDGATVKVIRVEGEWAYVEYNGKTGWSAVEYLLPVE